MFRAQNQPRNPPQYLLGPSSFPPVDQEEEPTEPKTQEKPQEKPQAKPEAKALGYRAKLPPVIRTSMAGHNFVQGMINRGWTPAEAAAAAGNVHVESGFFPGIKSLSPGEQSFGLMQWNGDRLAGLQRYGLAFGRDWKDPEVQMDYINMERNGQSVVYGGTDERRAYQNAFGRGGSAADMAERFGRYVERPLTLANTVDQRRAAAEEYSI